MSDIEFGPDPDVQEQQQPVVTTEASEDPVVAPEVPEADAVEQARTVSLDDEDAPRE